jgi:hypothetical protein
MKVSLTWPILVLLIAFTLYFFWKGCMIYRTPDEPFAPGIYTTNDISLRTCPPSTTSYVNSQGVTVCCNGTVMGSKCKGTEACSLSGASGSMPTCSEYYGSYLAQKGSLRCPSSMPNYYENTFGTLRGCTAGKRTPDGSAPATSAANCTLYQNEMDEMYKIDSCTNQLLLENTNCPGNAISKTLIPTSNRPYVYCSYNDNSSGIPQLSGCNENTTFLTYIQSYAESVGLNRDTWIQNSENWDPLRKLAYCSLYEKYAIEKSITIDDVKKMPIL